MLLLLSPAKALDFESPTPASLTPTQPEWAEPAHQLIQLLRAQTTTQISELMELSDALSALNVKRYQAWQPTHNERNAKPAALAFNGDVYEGLRASSLRKADLEWAQSHVRILSGLYGMLRPLDLIQPHRLEMGTSLKNPRGKNLYAYWSEAVTQQLARELSASPEPVLINLASQEYFKVVNARELKVPVVECVFQERKGPTYKIISFSAKRARGLMARHIIEHRLRHAPQLQSFNAEGYTFTPEVSTDTRLVFRREAP